MKVLGLVGGARREGNTVTLVGQILDGAKSKGAEVEQIFLTDFSIKYIQDCRECRKAGHCLIEDDFDKIMEKVYASDIIVFGTPLYWFGPSAQFKVFLDRWNCPLSLNPQGAFGRLKGKKWILAVPQGSPDMHIGDHLFAMMERGCGLGHMEYVGGIQVQALGRKDVAKNEVVKQQAFQLGAAAVEFGTKIFESGQIRAFSISLREPPTI